MFSAGAICSSPPELVFQLPVGWSRIFLPASRHCSLCRSIHLNKVYASVMFTFLCQPLQRLSSTHRSHLPVWYLSGPHYLPPHWFNSLVSSSVCVYKLSARETTSLSLCLSGSLSLYALLLSLAVALSSSYTSWFEAIHFIFWYCSVLFTEQKINTCEFLNVTRICVSRWMG